MVLMVICNRPSLTQLTVKFM